MGPERNWGFMPPRPAPPGSFRSRFKYRATAGTVVETGAAVTRFHVGDKITSHLYSKWLDGPIGLNSGDTLYGGPLPGGLAEYMLLNELTPFYICLFVRHSKYPRPATVGARFDDHSGCRFQLKRRLSTDEFPSESTI